MMDFSQKWKKEDKALFLFLNRDIGNFPETLIPNLVRWAHPASSGRMLQDWNRG
jgi:hypothetical protein